MVALRPLSCADIPVIRGWPAYPPDFAMLDYCHRDGGWLDTYGKDGKNAVFVAADGGDHVGIIVPDRLFYLFVPPRSELSGIS